MLQRSFARCASTVAQRTLSRGSGRYEITSQPLCDDILKRLQTSLPPPHTCDIIDINPGQGLWSKSLHHLLQPRRHVLVESELEKYAEHLQPLLKSHGSAYRHATLLEDVFDPGKQLLTQYDVEKAASLEKPPEHNRSLLMTVNLSGTKISIGGYMGSPSKKFFDELYLSLLSNTHTGFFRYGLVRVLAWVPEYEKDTFIPRTVHTRRKQTIMLEATTDITEVAGASTETKSTRHRKWPDLELEELAVVDARAKAIPGYKIPKSRLEKPPPRELLTIEPTPRNLRKANFTSDAEWVPRLLELDRRIKKQYPHWYRRYASGESIRKLGLKTPLHKEWGELLRRAKTTRKTHLKAVELVNQERQLISEWKLEICTATNHQLDLATEISFQERAEAIKNNLKAFNRTNRIFAEKAIDDCRAWDMSPPVLAWNRREAHPLIAHDGEFDAPRRYMALLDVTPRADLISKIDNYDKMVCFRYIVTLLSLSLSRSVAAALRTLVHEGLNDFVKTIPGIHDPTKGGWYDLTTLRVRVLPMEMFVEIGLAYEKWPFRMTTEAILMANSDPNAGYSGDEDDMK
ncbi:uncharacterized protein Z520_01663 [Fonsecaea multimorphosa CBS 102226]|uniref:rRNA adenine N(6)-methyltransferase n=1 Tax=Fonsecaea multimorphosa CBS 102226 TaxID=1442371 RepID=A0A0D2HMW5_9EURO|nr:uncharacterized protein Z520_01663 [Fonsecaea multimorphosa CBS 102226]KIY03196.1 hypothetical protein Z520_01663 [Fonsecaea multimorphosa CBS 102226]OAL30438.1 hypothetical protein AYO22_01636 [Fonsecaea multimorphosa]